MSEKILFLQPPKMVRGDLNTGPVLFPIALINIASYLKHHYKDIEIKIDQFSNIAVIDEPLKKLGILIDHLEKLLTENNNYSMIGISCYSTLAYIPSILVGFITRALKPETKIVVGGIHPTAMPKDFYDVTNIELRTLKGENIRFPEKIFEYVEELEKRRYHVFDYVIRGEGEHALYELMKKGKRPENTTTLNSTPLTEEEMNAIEYLWGLAEPLKDKGKTSYPVIVSRGCPQGCKFCGNLPKKWRVLSPKKAIKILREIVKEYLPDRIDFSDAFFGCKKEWKNKFLELLEKERTQNEFYCETRVDYTSDKDLERYLKLNFAQVDFGIDGVSKRMAKIMGKTRDPENYIKRAEETVKKAEEIGLPIGCALILGFPGENEATLQETLKFISLNQKPSITSYYINQYTHYPTTMIFGKEKYYERRYGTIFHMPPEPWKILTTKTVAIMGHISPSKELTYKKLVKTVLKLKIYEASNRADR